MKEMHDEIIQKIEEFKKASDMLMWVLNYNTNNEEYNGMEEYRERVEKFCLGYDDHMALRTLHWKFVEDKEKLLKT